MLCLAEARTLIFSCKTTFTNKNASLLTCSVRQLDALQPPTVSKTNKCREKKFQVAFEHHIIQSDIAM